MRFFIALEIPDSSKDEIKQIQQQLRHLVPDLRLTEPEKLHLTIAFIGEQANSLTDDLTNIINQATRDIPPFTITPAYLDGFPNLHHAQILWVGVKGDSDKLMILRERIKDGLVGLGIEVDERRFVPHIAIAKVNNFKLDPKVEEKIQQLMQQNFAPIQIHSVKLFESIPNHDLHSHNTLSEVKLSFRA